MAHDHSQVLHLIITLLSAYLFVLFAWWWIKQGGATMIYGITCVLMLGLCLTHLGAWYLYWCLANEMHCLNFLSAWWWPYRQYPTLIALVVYAIHVTCRACFSTRLKNNMRRLGDL